MSLREVTGSVYSISYRITSTLLAEQLDKFEKDDIILGENKFYDCQC